VNKEEIPLWSKKDGLYSTLPKILNCEDKYNPNKNELEEESPKIVGTKLEISLEIMETDSWVFYWATEAGSSLEGDKPEDPATSYGDESNHGVTKTDKDGNANLVLNCPRLYKEDKTLYPRHVHYTVLTEDDVWSTTIGTLEVMCKVPYDIMKQIIGKKTYLVMNALSKEAYNKQHIPHSILCHHESLIGLTKQKKDGVIKQLIKESLEDLPEVKEFVDSTSIKDVPIIVYCAHSDCDASSKLIDHLYSCGYYNVMEYPGGTKEWFSKTKDTELFEDMPSDEEISDDGDDGEDDEDGEDEATKLSEDEEIIVYDGIQYIHKLDTDEVLTKEDMEVIGTYDGEDIEWNSTKEYKNHLKRIKDKGGKRFTADEEEEEEEEGEEEEGEEEEEEEEEEEDDEDDEDDEEEEEEVDHESSDDDDDDDDDDDLEEYNEESLQSKKVSELKELLDKLKEKSVSGKKQDIINCLVKCKPVFKGGGAGDNMIYGGGINQSLSNQGFRGWGFTFLR